MTAAGVPPPPPAPSGPAAVHPLATASVVLSILGIGPLIVVGGLIGAPLGAVAARRVAAEPDRWRGLERARIGIVVGLFTGATPVVAFCLAKSGEWGWAPAGIAAAYVALVALLAVGRGRGGAAIAGGVGGVVLTAVAALAALYGIVWVFVYMANEVWDAIFGG